MLVNQLSVFMENKEGRLEQVLQTLAEGNININSEFLLKIGLAALTLAQ